MFFCVCLSDHFRSNFFIVAISNFYLILQHALLLPSFLFLSSNLSQTIKHFSSSSPIDFPLLESYQLSFPKSWILLFVNVVSSYCCSRSVFLLTGVCTSLTITLLITLRKFFSLILSIYIFKNVFTLQHWIGTFLVFTGTLIFADINHSNLIRFKSTDKVKHN